jgi:hypothetical protein
MTTYRCGESVDWLRDDDTILLLERESRRHRRLRGHEALLWELMCQGSSFEHVLEVLMLAAELERESATAVITGTLGSLQQDGFIVVAEAPKSRVRLPLVAAAPTSRAGANREPSTLADTEARSDA